MHDMPQKSDPATFEIVKNSLYKIAEEMRVVLAKTAYSPLLNRPVIIRAVSLTLGARWSRKDPTYPFTSARCPMQSAPLSLASHPTCTTAMFSSTTIPISAAAICRT